MIEAIIAGVSVLAIAGAARWGYKKWKELRQLPLSPDDFALDPDETYKELDVKHGLPPDLKSFFVAIGQKIRYNRLHWSAKDDVGITILEDDVPLFEELVKRDLISFGHKLEYNEAGAHFGGYGSVSYHKVDLTYSGRALFEKLTKEKRI